MEIKKKDISQHNYQKNRYLFLVLTSLAFITNLFLNMGISYASSNPNSYEYLKLEIDNTLSFKTKIDNNFKINEFNVSSYFFPITYNGSQYLNSFETSHNNYNILNDSGSLYLNFNFDESTISENNIIENKFILENTINRPKIKVKQEYPIKYLTSENKKYLEFSGLINSDDDIKKQASNLAQGESDVFIIASKTAKWIKEDVNYNLSTVISNPNQSSSEVFKSKSGVCKEITNLYVSMMRSVGIPARVVTGYAYTNSPEVVSYVGDNWGGHAWAEVLVGDTWVPFDLTYNQYGYVDPAHIVLDKSAISKNKGMSISANSYGVNLVSESLFSKNKFIIEDMQGNLFDEGFNIKVEGPQEIGLESYGYLKISIENKDDYYKILFLKLAKPTEINLLDNSEKMLIFTPHQKKEVYFRYNVAELDDNYIYTFPFLIYNDFSSTQYNVTVQKDNLKIKQIALPQEKEEKIIYSSNKLEFDCNFIIDSPNNLILCSVRNPNNYEINNMDVCVTTECKKIDLKINELKSISFETDKFSETVSYIYENENNDFSLSIQKPFVEYSSNITEDKLNFNYHINNYLQNLELNIYLNDNLIQTSTMEENNYAFNLIEGSNTLSYELKLKDKLLDNSSFNVDYEKKSFIESPVETSKNWFDNIINWIKSLF